MRSWILSVALVAGMWGPAHARGGGHSHASHSSHSHASVKSHAAGSHDGTFVGGTGSSHKGGHYVNPKTNDHYRAHK
jgi:hypothetical protein